MDYGDYCANAVLPSGKPVLDASERLYPLAVIERKMDLDELATCFTTGRERFTREFERASEHCASVWLLVEGGNWEKIFRHQYRSNMTPAAFVGSLTAFCVRYGAHIVFCDELTTPMMIREILYRDLKERLERGDFDCPESTG